MTLLSIIRREFYRLYKQPKNFSFLFGAPTLFVLLFGLIYINHVVKEIPTVVFDASQTELSRSLVTAFDDSEKYRIIGYVSSQEEMEDYLKSNRAIAAVAIPEKFSRNVKRGHSSEVLIMVNGTNMIYANAVISSANEIIQTFSAGVSVRSLEALGQMPNAAVQKAAPVQMRLRLLHNPTLNYTNFMLIGIMLAVVQQAVMLTVALAMVEEYRKLDELVHVPAWKVLLGKATPYWLCGMAAFTIGLGLTYYLYEVPFRGSLLEAYGLVALFLGAITFAGMSYSALCPDELTATQYAMLYVLPAFLYSGFTWPVESMNFAGKVVSAIFPLSYAACDLRDLMLAGAAPGLAVNMTVLAGMTIGFYLAATGIFTVRRKKWINADSNRTIAS